MACSNWVVTLEAIPKVGPSFFSFFLSQVKDLVQNSFMIQHKKWCVLAKLMTRSSGMGPCCGDTIRGEFVSNVLLLSLSIHKDLKLVCTWLY